MYTTTTTDMPVIANNNTSKPVSTNPIQIFDGDLNLIEFLTRISHDKSFSKLDEFSKVLSSPDTEDSVLCDWLSCLRDNIFFLDKENEKVTVCILKMNWSSKSPKVVVLYQELIKNLVSAHCIYLKPVLNSIIDVFLTASETTDFNSEEVKVKLQNVHNLLKAILTLIPMSPPVLCKQLSDRFPYFKRPTQQIVGYVVNILTICNYLSSHRLNLLMDLVDKYLQIDVHCSRDIIVLWEAQREESMENSLALGLMDETMTSSMQKSMAYLLANTMDTLMETLFKFIESTCDSKTGESLNWEETKKLYRELLTVFDRIVLPTFGCCHVQFAMFYVCGLKMPLAEGFIDFLWKKVKNPMTSNVIRQASAFYLGTFLARANYINISTVCACFDLISSWVHTYINSNDSSVNSDQSAHGTFHCVCQVLFYVFAFRHKEFVAMENGFKYLRSLNFERIVASRLNPLRFCQQTIVQNFASIARSYQIAYCYTTIERNNRCLVGRTTNSDNFAAMTTFFPFDPYLLKNSKRWIDPLYRVYTGHSDEETIDDEDEAIPEEEQMFSYSSSPGFKH